MSLGAAAGMAGHGTDDGRAAMVGDAAVEAEAAGDAPVEAEAVGGRGEGSVGMST